MVMTGRGKLGLKPNFEFGSGDLQGVGGPGVEF